MSKVGMGRSQSGQTPRARGGFLITDHNGKFIAQKWPRKRGAAKTPYDWYKQQEFALAGRMASNAISEDIFTATEMVKGSQQVPRDFITMAIFGQAYELYEEDGFIWPTFRQMSVNPQYVLDLITTQVGSVIYRAEIGWIGLEPGNNGDVLTINDGIPEWAPSSGGAGGGVLVTTLRKTINGSFANTTTWTAPLDTADLDEMNLWDPANPNRLYFPPTATKIRLSASVLFTGSSVNQMSTVSTPDNLGSSTWLGALHNQLTRNTVTGATKEMTAIGPWVPNPGTDYCTLVWTQTQAQSARFENGTTFTLEATF